MKIESVRIINGANVYSHQPVIVARLDLEKLKGTESRDAADFNPRLLERLPGLRKHFCDAGKPGGFVRRLHNGTHFNHVIEHIAIELLAQAGLAPRDKKICNKDERDDSLAVIETTAVETTRYLMPLAADFADAIIKEKSFSFEEKITEAKNIASDTELGPSGQAIVGAAEKRGIPWARENEYGLVQLGYGKNLHFVQSAVTDQTSRIAAGLASDKDETKRRLEKFSIPVPLSEVVLTEAEAVEALKSIGAPVAVKPLDGRQGKGVSLNLSTADEVISAFRVAREFSRKILIEELFEGKNYRVLIVGGKMVAASERLPCHIEGDGRHMIAELIEIENRNLMRAEGHEKPLTPIKITSVLLAALLKEGWILEDVPEDGEQITLRAGMNLLTGGTAKDVTDEVHKSVKTLCERAARIINLDICGVDLALKDISAPVPKKSGGIITINAAPDLRIHCFPAEGKPRDVGGAIVEMLYPNDAPSRIPIVAITGTNGKTTVTRMISHVLLETKLNIGTTTTDGILFNGESIVFGDTTGPASARTILGDKAVDIAVLETARGGILKRGLGWDWADVGVVTNITEDHIGQDGIESVKDLVNIKSLVAERVRENGTLVLNADDPESAGIVNRPAVIQTNRKIVYFALSEENFIVKPHLKKGETAYFVRDNWIYEASGEALTRIVETTAIPVTMNGTADFQIQNAMAAIAASRALHLSPEKIADALGKFQGDKHNPGRNNLYKVGAGYVLVDYGHNTDGFAAVCRMARRWTGKTVTAIIGLPGDRDNRIIEEAAQVAARGFNRVIVTEEVNPRGRARGGMAGLLCGAIKREKPGANCEIIFDEIEAFSKALAQMRKDEVIVIFYRQRDLILEILTRNRAVSVSSFEETIGVN
ncbi:MAG: cyanophycin synthetase [Acidobacteria bacterium]|nr:cyanophycin synthetase [Acidobacteriota bacterium]